MSMTFQRTLAPELLRARAPRTTGRRSSRCGWRERALARLRLHAVAEHGPPLRPPLAPVVRSSSAELRRAVRRRSRSQTATKNAAMATAISISPIAP